MNLKKLADSRINDAYKTGSVEQKVSKLVNDEWDAFRNLGPDQGDINIPLPGGRQVVCNMSSWEDNVSENGGGYSVFVASVESTKDGETLSEASADVKYTSADIVSPKSKPAIKKAIAQAITQAGGEIGELNKIKSSYLGID